MHERVLERLELNADLQHAVVADEFAVHHQPIATLQSGSFVEEIGSSREQDRLVSARVA